MRAHAMQAGLSVRFERGPDFFALHRANSPDHRTWIAIRRGRIVGIISAVIRLTYVDRAVRKAAYFSDLRQSRGKELAGFWRSAATTVLDEVREEFGVTHAFFSVLRNNRLARASILESQLGTELGIRHLRGYATVSIIGRLPWPRRHHRRLEVRRATTADSELLRDFIDTQGRDLQFAPVIDRRTWQRRISDWPDFSIGNFLIAIDAGHGVVGCVAPWDSSRINRIVVDKLPRRAELLRRAFNAISPLLRRPGIVVGPSAHLSDVALTHLRVANRDPQVFAALLTAAFREQMRTRRFATMSLCLFDGDPLWRALSGTIRNSVPMDLFHLHVDRRLAPPVDASMWPAFEHYLA